MKKYSAVISRGLLHRQVDSTPKGLLYDESKQSKVTRALDSAGEFALLFGTYRRYA